MVKFYTTNFTYDHPFPTVTLAYFLRYPNPYSTHVLSTDVIERSFDPVTQRLTTVRLHLKRSKLPPAVLKLLPRSLVGASAGGDSQSYILEKSVVDVREGWMDTESRNLEWTSVLSVVERQTFRRPREIIPCNGTAAAETTDVKTTVTLHSNLGRKKKANAAARPDEAGEEEPTGRLGLLKSWSTGPLQRSIESIGLKRATKSQPNAKEGMKVVLERLRQGGLVAVLEGMRKDRESAGAFGFKRSDDDHDE